MEILDAHQHLGIIADFVKGGEGRSDENPEELEYRTRVEAMDRSEIHRAVIGPSYQYLMPEGVADTRRLNDRLAAFRDRDPERFPFAVGAIEPRQGEAALEEVRRVRQELGMVGVMWHNRLQGCYVDSPWMHRCTREAVDVGLVPFVHSHHGSLLESPWRVERLAQEFPDTTFVVIDGLAGYEETELFYDIVRRRENLVFDTGMWSGGIGKVNTAARVLGVDRLVFGSGLYSHPMGFRRTQTVEAVRESRLTEDEQAQVLALNLYRILGKAPLGAL
ncbi:MAG: amidohydrolase family protein [Dehalococcoidia bacterium]